MSIDFVVMSPERDPLAVGTEEDCTSYVSFELNDDHDHYTVEPLPINDAQHERLIDGIKERYEKRINALLEQMSDLCVKEGMISGGIGEMHDEEYRWYLTLWRCEDDRKPYREYGENAFGVDPKEQVPCYDKSVDIAFEIAEAQTYGDDPIDGVNFAVQITENGGRMLGGLTPYNYTGECWVPASDEDAVEERFKIMEDASIDSVPDAVRG